MGFDVKRDVDKTLELMDSNLGVLNYDYNYAKPYILSTLNHRMIFDNLEGKIDSFLGVIGSFNPVLDAIYKGAKNVVCFDKSIPVIYRAYLVLAAFKALTYEEMLDYMCFKAYDEDLYLKVRDYLPSNALIDARKYFDILYDYKGDLELRDHFTIINHMEDIRVINPKANGKDLGDFFLRCNNAHDYIYEREVFYDLKEKLFDANIKIMHADIYDIPDEILEKFNYIYLSCANIFLYDRHFRPDEVFMDKYPQLLSRYSDMLSDDGTLLAGYIYSSYLNHDYYMPMDRYFRSCGFGTLSDSDGNTAYVYRKR